MIYTSRVFSSEKSIYFHGFHFRKLYTLPWFPIPKIVNTSWVFSAENRSHFMGLGFSVPKIVYTSRALGYPKIVYTSRALGFQSRKQNAVPGRWVFNSKNRICIMSFKAHIQKNWGRGVWGAKHPGKAGGFGGRRPPNGRHIDIFKSSYQGDSVLVKYLTFCD